MPIKKLLIILGSARAFKIKIPIIKKNINLIFFSFEKAEKKTINEVKITNGILKTKVETAGSP